MDGFFVAKLKKMSNKVKKDDGENAEAEAAEETEKINGDEGDEMDVEDAVASDRTADGGTSAGSDVETKDDSDMAEANGKTRDGGLTKVKRKFLNRRERKSLPSKQEIAEKREEKRQAMREGKRKTAAAAAPAVAIADATPMDVVSPGKKSAASNGKAKKTTASPLVTKVKKPASAMKEGSSSKKRKTAK